MRLFQTLRLIVTATAFCAFARLFAQSGTLDQSFNASDIGFGAGDGFTGTPQVVLEQPDGKILIGGNFTRFNTVPRQHLIRLNADGTVDLSLNAGTMIAGNYVNTLALQLDGKIIAGGNWQQFISRFLPNGQLDPSFDVGVGPNGEVSRIVLQPDGKMLVSGSFSQFDGTFVPGLVRLNADGSVDPTFTAGLNAEYTTTIELQPDGKILLAGSSFFPYPDLVRLNPNGVVDGTFSTGTGPASGGVYDLLVQPDGKILAAGNFATFNGQAVRTVVRLETDGSLDPSFNCGTGGDQGVMRIALRADGRIVCGGMFNTLNGTFSAGLVQLLADGSLDPLFQTSGGFAPISPAAVYDLALKPDGSTIVIGGFGAYAGVARNQLARILDDGSLDPVFHRQHGVEGVVNDIAVRSDGRIMIAGIFLAVNNEARPRVARLFADGTLDPGFVPDSVFSQTSAQRVVIQSDDKVVVLGQQFGTPSVAYLSRLNTDGSVDPTFDTGTGFDHLMQDLVLQPDGKFIVGGDETEYDGVLCGSIVRILPDGAIDPTFNTGSGFDGRVYTLALQADGKIIAGGQFTSFNGTSAFRLARLNTDGTLDPSFTSAVNTEVRAVAMRADGRILVAYGGSLPNKVACLLPTGAFDPTFNNGQVLFTGSNWIWDLAELSSGEIVLGGRFSTVHGEPREGIAVLTTDGYVSTVFDPGAGFTVPNSNTSAVPYCLAIQPDDRILVGGSFTAYDGIGRNRLARINYEFSTGLTAATSSDVQLMVWPVPSSTGTIQVKLPADLGATDLRITGLDGRTVRTGSIGALPQDRIVTLSTAGLSAGSYLLTLSAGDQQRQRLFLVE
ncbi:MAG: hypothetical protein IPK99_09485 [Flavobacteriales bacterium]|nr:hypothetical protein [Flavobacteriales bacterium]